MSVTVNINNLTLCHRGSGGISTASVPDVCNTPAPGGPIPLPYPNIAMSSDLANGTSGVTADGGNPCANYGSDFAKSTGDEPGTAGGVISGTFTKEATWLTFSFDVKLEGRGACRLTDKMFHNSMNTVNVSGLVQASLSQGDLGLLKCILELCKSDPDVVEKLQKSNVYGRDPKKVIVTSIDRHGKQTQREVISGGTHSPGNIWLNRGTDCDTVKRAAYHEAAHSAQPADMARPLKEIEAFTKTEEWAIKRGLPGPPQFRTQFGSIQRVNTEGIRQHVMKTYGYNIPKQGPLPPQVTGTTPEGNVKLDDGTTRPAKEGDAFHADAPNQQLNEVQIPPDQIKCPPKKGKE
jgi:hypothetical protein